MKCLEWRLIQDPSILFIFLLFIHIYNIFFHLLWYIYFLNRTFIRYHLSISNDRTKVYVHFTFSKLLFLRLYWMEYIVIIIVFIFTISFYFLCLVLDFIFLFFNIVHLIFLLYTFFFSFLILWDKYIIKVVISDQASFLTLIFYHLKQTAPCKSR